MVGTKQSGWFRPPNPNAISKNRPYEIFLTNQERRDTILPSGHTVGQSFGMLHNLWKQYKSYRQYMNTEMEKVTAAKIQDVQREMGIAVAVFPELGLYITDEELPANEIHLHEEVIALHDRITQRELDEAYEDREQKKNEKEIERETCDYWRY